MTVIAPADHEQAAAALRATWELPGPVYYRLGKDDKTVPGLDGRFDPDGRSAEEGRRCTSSRSERSRVRPWPRSRALAAAASTPALAVVSVNPAPADELRQALAACRSR